MPGDANQLGLVSQGLAFLNNTTNTFVPVPSVASGNVVTDTGTGFISSPPATLALPVVNVTSASQAMAVNTRYVVNFASTCTLTTPATFAENSIITINNIGTGNIVIQMAAGQSCIYPAGVTSTAGTMTSTTTGQTIFLQGANTTNTQWISSMTGNFVAT